MNAKNYSPLVCEKLRLCSLFRIYAEAFETMTGCGLDLVKEVAEGCHALPVRMGSREPCLLVVKPGATLGKLPKPGILESFAIQLGEEANRAVLESNHAEPLGVRKAKGYIHQNRHTKISLDEVARAAEVASFQLCRLFKKTTKVTMTEYVSRLRVENSRRKLMNPDRNVSEIAREVGFSSLSQFNRNFRKYAGESPSEYRERLKTLEHIKLGDFPTVESKESE